MLRIVCLLAMAVAMATAETAMPCCGHGLYIFDDLDHPDMITICINHTSGVKSDLQLKCSIDHTMLSDVYHDQLNTTTRFEGDYLLVHEENGIPDKKFSPDKYCTGKHFVRDAEETNKKDAYVLCDDVGRCYNYNIVAYMIIVSAIFFFITAAVYLTLEQTRDLLGKLLINYCIIAAVANSLLYEMWTGEHSVAFCAVKGLATYYFTIASFFAMNTLAVENLLSLRNPANSHELSRLKGIKGFFVGHKRFWKYLLYSWGTPAVITAIVVAINFSSGDFEKPGFGVDSSGCWFRNVRQQMFYLFSVMIIVIVVNIAIFFYYTIVLNRDNFGDQSKIHRFRTTVQVFFVIGITWIFEVIIAYTEGNIVSCIMYAINALQGVFIFILLVVFKIKVIRGLREKNVLCWVPAWLQRKIDSTKEVEIPLRQ